jgi:hypothetical protein
MSDIPAEGPFSIDLRLKLAQIDQALASHDMMRVQTQMFRVQQDQLAADRDLKRQEFDLGWHKLLLTAIGTAAALPGAGFAFGKLFH